MAFAHSFWLILLVLVPFIGAGALLIARVRGRRWQAFVAGRLRPTLLQRSSTFAHWVAFVSLLASLAILIVTLARPQGDAGTQSEVVRGRNVLYALDLSRSMRVDDVKPDRLGQAKAIIYEMMDAMPNDRVGLVGFAGNPYLFAPLTIDHAAVRETVEQLDETWIPTGGSDIVAALKLSIETLKKTGIRNNALVLISDGEKHDGDFDEIVREAKEAGVFVFTVGVGTEEGGFVPHPSIPEEKMRDRRGNVILSRLHPEVLKKIASETKGSYVLAGSGVDIPALANTAMADLDQFELQGRERRVVVEFYQWLLAPAILSLLISILAATRWRPIAARTAVAATMAGSVSSAGAAPAQESSVVATNPNEKARLEFHDLADKTKNSEDAARYRLGEASAAFKSKNFRKASDAYSRALLSEDPGVLRAGYLGNGSSLFQLGWQSLGDDQSYPDPPPADMEAFDTLVRAKLKEWMESEVPEAGETAGFTLFDSLIVNWTDSLRHFDSALQLDLGDSDALQNRELVNRYLDRLQELIKEESDQAKQSLPQEQGEGPPQQGEGEQKGKSGQPGEEGEEGEPGEEGKNGEKKDQDGSGGKEREDSKQGEGGDKEKDKGSKEKPGETPKERAERILGENEDMQKGPMTPGRREFRPPEKDW